MASIIADHQIVKPIRGNYLVWMLAMALLVVIGGYCAYTMEHEGHHISGMNNRVVWGLPHVFAISLILAASGALNSATLSSVFNQSMHKPWARLSVVLAICLLISGLLVLVLDLGRPDRLFIAMTTYNFRSIFSWNIFLYTGFIAVCVVYLATLLDRSLNRYIASIGALALLWRIVLTTGTGSIFGFLVGRSALDTAILAPLFIALSLVMGSAVFALVVALVSRWQGTPVPANTIRQFSKLMLWCLLALLYFSVVHHLTNLYVSEHSSDERTMFTGPMALPFWLGHITLFGVCVWLVSRQRIIEAINQKQWLLSCVAALFGSAMILYSTIIGSQLIPQNLFPGKEVTSSTFGDAGFASYFPSVWEWGLGMGGVALSMLLLGFFLRVLPVSAHVIEPVADISDQVT